MKLIPISKHLTDCSRLIYGAMNLGGPWDDSPVSIKDEKLAQEIIETCIEVGINIIDLADIYTFGKAETVFGKVLRKSPKLSEKIFLQSKLGIKLAVGSKVKQYDLSPDYVSFALDNLLQRLQIEKIDVLFLHRPDPLADVPSLAKTLNRAWHDDKFDFLAVSNMHAGQIAMLQQHLEMPIIANQLEMSLMHNDFVEDGITVNMRLNASNGFPRGTLEFCMQQGIQLQAWGAVAQGQFTQTEHHDPNIAATAKLLTQLAEKYNTNINALVVAWLTRHPAQIQPVIGTTNPSRIRNIADASNILLSRDDWYQILQTRRGHEIP